jgi:uncharacterized protein (UPF0276 family)
MTHTAATTPVPGRAGVGLRREFVDELIANPSATIDFVEIAPENWLNMGGRHRARLRAVAGQYPIICHGLSLSLGGPAPLDTAFLQNLGRFLNEYQVPLYSEHLSYCTDDGHLYDLLPIPFTEEAVKHTAQRIRQTQDILGRRIAVENVSYYAAPGQRMGEAEFVRAVLDEADCDLLLDVNNIYVNSINHGYDALDFLRTMPARRIAYLHVAGHFVEPDGLIIDTHGMPVIDPVWKLLDEAYATFGIRPTLLERDFNVPPLSELLAEVGTIRRLQQPWLAAHRTLAHAL